MSCLPAVSLLLRLDCSALQARYLLDLASHFQSGQLSDAKIALMDDDTLVAELTKVKGIGKPCQPCKCPAAWVVSFMFMFMTQQTATASSVFESVRSHRQVCKAN